MSDLQSQILISTLVLAILTIFINLGRKTYKQIPLSKLHVLGCLFFIAGIFFKENQQIRFSLISIGYFFAMINMVKYLNNSLTVLWFFEIILTVGLLISVKFILPALIILALLFIFLLLDRKNFFKIAS